MLGPARIVAAATKRASRFVSTAAVEAQAVVSKPAAAAVAPSAAVKLPVQLSGREAPVVRYNAEDTNSVDIAEVRRTRVLTEVADEYAGRVAVIYKQSQSAMTSGMSASRSWGIRMTHADKWSNQLMGWVSSADTQQYSVPNVKFDTPEQAVLFCERNGWEYRVDTIPPERTAIAVDDKTVGNQYSYNILSLEVQAKMKRAGNPRRARHQFANPDAPSATGVSTWSNLRHTGYGPDPWRPRPDIKQDMTAWTGPEWPAPKEILPPLAAGETPAEQH